MDPIEATTPIAVTLTAAQWNALLSVLAEGPYRTVAPLIGAITEQAQRAGAGSAAAAPRPNGADALRPEAGA